MTINSAIIAKNGIIVVTDSLLTARKENGETEYIAWKKSKIIFNEKLGFAITYWGFAGNWEPKRKKFQFSTFDFLNSLMDDCAEKKYSLSDTAKYFHEKWSIKNQILANPGIGMHLVGNEKVGNNYIPELYLLSNFTDPSYQNIGNFNITRETYHTISKDENFENHSSDEIRIQVLEYLKNNELLIFNNGDPIFFNIIANSIFNSIKYANSVNKLKPLNTLTELSKIPISTVEFISKLQNNFFRKGEQIVGGKVHAIGINEKGKILKL
ncbi:hypothetical protein [Leptospira vanthielii]|uniref:Uncharacterized protein n=1 Tax=Leptospira vanthielii TaxID=293085 RepID=A0ABY2NK35_9LEPT|nr:hypothetical protein [Leptospira vanthielii]TGM45984.1 hypothetical protein EHQ95_17505 [Leptospira vanthielii]